MFTVQFAANRRTVQGYGAAGFRIQDRAHYNRPMLTRLSIRDFAVVAHAELTFAQGLTVIHVDSAEAAIEYLDLHHGAVDEVGADLVLTDVYLNGPLGGLDVLKHVRHGLGYSKRLLPALVMTGDENPDKQRELFLAGANDLVLKPVEERMVVTKILFQLRAARLHS